MKVRSAYVCVDGCTIIRCVGAISGNGDIGNAGEERRWDGNFVLQVFVPFFRFSFSLSVAVTTSVQVPSPWDGFCPSSLSTIPFPKA